VIHCSISQINKQLLILVHKFLYYNEKLPPAFNNYFTLNYNVHNYNTRKSNELHLQSLQTTFGKKIIKFKASQLWNQLPNEIKEIKSQNLFKSKLKNYLYSILQTLWKCRNLLINGCCNCLINFDVLPYVFIGLQLFPVWIYSAYYV